MLIKLSILYVIISHYSRISLGNPYIYGGLSAKPGQFPHQVSLRSIRLPYCSGAILNNRWIVTVRHCMDEKPEHMRVVVGTIYLTSGGVVHDVLLLKHHTRDDVGDNDIGLIKVKEEIVFNKDTQPIAISDELLYPGTRATISGWGETDQERVPLNLRYLNVELITRKKCAENRFPFWIDDALICSKNPHNYGMCFGDSGGLLTINEKLVGIITYVNSSGCAKEYPDVCVSVPYFKEWIEQNID